MERILHSKEKTTITARFYQRLLGLGEKGLAYTLLCIHIFPKQGLEESNAQTRECLLENFACDAEEDFHLTRVWSPELQELARVTMPNFNGHCVWCKSLLSASSIFEALLTIVLTLSSLQCMPVVVASFPNQRYATIRCF